jgi:20S proteasome subunit beta 6
MTVSITSPICQVGDGLEMFIVLAKGRTLPDAVVNLRPQELPSTVDGERVFVLKRDLKKD